MKSAVLTLAAFTVVVTIGIALIGATWKLARAAGRLETAVRDLTDTADDHEDRLRVIERRPRRARAGR